MRAVLVFARSPHAEAAAKRLAGGGERLFEGVVRAWIRVARHCGASVIVACAPEHRAAFRHLAGIDGFVHQAGRAFGERLAAAGRAAFALHFDRLLITGIDTPPPDASAIGSAFAAVEEGAAAAVIAPSTDGGINFLVLGREDVGLLEQFVPRDPALMERCRRHFEQRGLVETAAAPDLDSRDMIPAAFREAVWRPYRCLLERASVPPVAAPDTGLSLSFHAPAHLRAPPRVAL